jgi:phosphohistidine swiveling domain-containing protein
MGATDTGGEPTLEAVLTARSPETVAIVRRSPLRFARWGATRGESPYRPCLVGTETVFRGVVIQPHESTLITEVCMARFVLELRDAAATFNEVGGKGASLTKMLIAGLPVPSGYHVTTEAYRTFVTVNELDPVVGVAMRSVDLSHPSSLEEASQKIRRAFNEATVPEEVERAILASYRELPGEDPSVAVRSSATAEDLPEASFAGQLESFLNVSGGQRVVEAVTRCWSSLWTARAIGYRMRQGITSTGVAVGVVIQELVDADAAGILFTVNPLKGRGEQALVNASWGLGDAVVGGRVTPDEYVIEKNTGRVVSRTISSKDVMTVRAGIATEDQTVPMSRRSVSVLGNAQLRELNALGSQIEDLFGTPMDVEWALAGGSFTILQARPITTFAPELSVEWSSPEPGNRYMRASIIDMMPNPISPLFETMGVPTYNASLQQLMVDLTGSSWEFFPFEVVRLIRRYAYMKVNYTARQWFGLLFIATPRLLGAIRRGPTHFREMALPEYRSEVEALSAQPVAAMSASELWSSARALASAATHHLSVLQVDTLGAAAGSEGLFTMLYNRFFRREGDPGAPVLLMGYDTVPIRAEKSLFDLAEWASDRPRVRSYLIDSVTRDICSATESSTAPQGVEEGDWLEWLRRIESHRRNFGHVLFDFDFATPVPAEDLAPFIESVKMYLRDEGGNPYTRQKRLETERVQATRDLLDRARGLRGWAVRKALAWAQRLAEVREDSIASVGLSYPRLREVLKELGRRLVETGAISRPDDVFWLEVAEVEARLDQIDRGSVLDSLADAVERRKETARLAGKVIPPPQIPPGKRYMGISVEAFVAGGGGAEGGVLKGVGASPGKVTGIARVVHGPQDFDEMQPRAILVAKVTTPAWTPLFTMAGGIVTDIGGPLSHGSIVAREYGIPAVLGTGSATRLIHTGEQVTVDGDAGLVTLREGM